MITIVKSGKNKEQRSTTCEKCGCEFLFDRSDCYWSRPLLTYIVTCPECENEIWLGDIYED